MMIEIKVGMWVKYNSGISKIESITETAFGNAVVDMEDGYFIGTDRDDMTVFPATKPEIAKELGWELAKAVGLWMSITYKDVDYPNSLVRAFEKVEYILEEIKSGEGTEK